MEHDPQQPEAIDEIDEAADLPDDPNEAFVFTGPDHRDMYILIAGLIAGLVLSPWLLGRFLEDQARNEFYFGAGEAWAQFEQKQAELLEIRKERADEIYAGHLAAREEAQQWYEQKAAEIRERHEAVGATPIALEADLAELADEYAEKLPTQEDVQGDIAALEAELDQQLAPYRAMLDAARQEHKDWLMRMLAGLVAALALLMFIEPVLQPLGRSAAVRTRLATGRYVLTASIIALLLCKASLLGGFPWLFVALLVGIALLAAAGSAAIGKTAK